MERVFFTTFRKPSTHVEAKRSYSAGSLIFLFALKTFITQFQNGSCKGLDVGLDYRALFELAHQSLKTIERKKLEYPTLLPSIEATTHGYDLARNLALESRLDGIPAIACW